MRRNKLKTKIILNSFFWKLLPFFIFFPLQLVEDGEISAMYWETEQKCRKLTKYMSFYILVHQAIVMGSFIYSIYCICIGNLDTSTWVMGFDIWLPFNTQNILGFYIKLAINLPMGLAYAVTVTLSTSFFSCCCIYIRAMCKHFNLIERKNESIHKKMAQAVDIHEKLVE